jgi:hypothetical protein
MIGLIGTSLQLQSIKIAHTLNWFWTTSVWQISVKNLSLLSISDWSLLLLNARINSFYNCHAADIEVTMSYSSSVLFVVTGIMFLIPKQRFCFLSVYNLQFPYPWNACFVISWFPGVNLSAETCLLIRFLETAHMSKYALTPLFSNPPL